MQSAQIHLFVFSFAVASGTLFGGHIGDRIGRKRVIWVSILGVAPFTLVLPYVSLAWTGPLTFVIGLILGLTAWFLAIETKDLLIGEASELIDAIKPVGNGAGGRR